MKHSKKIISSILTLTLFAGSVVNLTCFAAGSNSDKPNTQQQSHQEKSSDFDRCRNYADELDRIKNSVYGVTSPIDFDKAFEALNKLKSKLSESDKIVLAEHINATESYLKEMKEKSFRYHYKLFDKTSSENCRLSLSLGEKQNEIKKLTLALKKKQNEIEESSRTAFLFGMALQGILTTLIYLL